MQTSLSRTAGGTAPSIPGHGATQLPSAGRTYTLSGIVLFDYDGNVLRDEGDSISAGLGSALRVRQTAASSLAMVPAGRQGGAIRKLLAKALMDSPA